MKHLLIARVLVLQARVVVNSVLDVVLKPSNPMMMDGVMEIAPKRPL